MKNELNNVTNGEAGTKDLTSDSSGEKKKESRYKTDGGKTKSNAIEIPSISLPKGGGAIKGIDQKFSVNAVNGTAAFSIPLPISKARGVTPELNISYNSGNGNGVFGLGWSLNISSIKRKTDKQLPQYNDRFHSDTYLLSDAEDLVPEYLRFDGFNDPYGTLEPEDIGKFIKDPDGNFIHKADESVPGYTIHFYKPRIEGAFSRIERWTNNSSKEIRWRVFSKDNVMTLYGWSAASRISDPENSSRVFEWLIDSVFDDKGNGIYYRYRDEDNEGFNPSLPHNKNRIQSGNITYTNKYLYKILYGNKNVCSFVQTIEDSDFLFSIAFDYGQYNLEAPYTENGTWLFRSDPFSEYKAGFEIRTTRLCRRVLLFHHFPVFEEGFALVKSLNFTYGSNNNAGFTFLNAVTSTGHIKLSADVYSEKSLPPMEFTYSTHRWNEGVEIKEISPDNLRHAPGGLKTPYQFADLYNEGLSGILSEQAGAWYYKRNSGKGNFEAAHAVTPKPSFTGLGGTLQLLDLDSDGVKQIVNFNGSPQGYFELNDDNEWECFRSFKHLPNINLSDANAKLIDLNGDGKTDLLVTEDSVFTWWESEGREGFKDFYRTPKYLSEEDGPKLVFAEATQTIHLADMSGDGLIDIVRIRNGEICYWPNLGYGRFGTKIVMDNAPVFDNDADFDPTWVKLADLDGSGTPDLIYLGKNKFTCWLNFSGNSYSTTPFEIKGFPEINREADITITDLLGTGLSCIVWSSNLQRDARAPLRYIDLMKSSKPHIMIKHVNNMGLEVELEYTPSTKFYIDDKLAGKPWITKLHFPVYCVSKVTTSDKVTGHIFTSTYSYHHGYYDHAEKEFRGFGRVDQTDTEKAEHFVSSTGTNLINAELNQAPVLTKSWFHTGAYIRDRKILDQFAKEYWFEEYNNAFSPPVSPIESELPAARILADKQHAENEAYVSGISVVEKREAYRACKGMPLRVEVFALEGSDTEQKIPYTVSTHNCMIELLQPIGHNKHAVFCVKESEAITYTYERRDIGDARIAHKFNLEMDIYGNVLKSASVVYPRLAVPSGGDNLPAETDAAQAKSAVLYTVSSFTNDATDVDFYRLRLPAESQTYEVTKMAAKTGAGGSIYGVNDFNDLLNEDEIAYENMSPSGSVINIRLVEHIRSLYYEFDLSGPMALGEMSARGLPYENYQLAYTNDPANSNEFNLVYNIFNNKVKVTELNAGGFYTFGADTRRWIRSGIVNYITGGENETDALARFFIPLSYTDPRGNITSVTHDALYLFVEEITDAAGNITSVETFNYRSLTPAKIKDANDNFSEVLSDELGLPKALVLYGKGTEADDIAGLTPETPASELSGIADYFNEANAAITDSDVLTGMAKDLLSNATTRFVYDLFSYMSSGGIEPCSVSTIMRERHYVDDPDSPVQINFEYSSGGGKVVMKKIQAEPGLAKQVIPTGPATITVNNVNTADGSSALGVPSLRWIGNGRTVFNNKGNPIKQYEPFFSVTAKFENTKELVENGVTPILHYDALGRNIRTDFPDGSYSKTEYFGWKQVVYDQNDTCSTVTDPNDPEYNTWYNAMYAFGAGTPERAAAVKAALHYNTPKIIHFDSLGRPVSEQETDGTTEIYTHLILDIEGNLRAVKDARFATSGTECMQYKYDMLGQMVYQNSADSGQRWLLHNCMGKPIRTWDERDFEVQVEYDQLNRPLTVTVLNGDGASPLNNIVDFYEYGESITGFNPKNFNLRGQPYRHWDTGGVEETAAYDFKGNALNSERWLADDYKNVADWTTLPSMPPSGGGPLDVTRSYTISTLFDALNRIKEQTAPDASIITPFYNERGLFIAENVDQGAGNITHLASIDYDAKGQRTKVEYGNGVLTSYTYDENTFRLKTLTTRNSGGDTYQDLFYVYDAVGNITLKADKAIPKTFYNNDFTTGNNEYTYDALYRLIEATGRESTAAASFGMYDNWDDASHKYQHAPADLMQQQNYTQQYDYDVVGNIVELRHTAGVGSYTRTYTYNNPANNRLTRTQVGSTNYNYSYHAQHGFISSMPHLHLMEWDFKEQLTASSTQVVAPGETPETTWYQYDSQGKRLRKITENYAHSGPGTQKNQRVYIEGYEYFEEFGGGDVTHSLSLIDQGQRFVMIENSMLYGLLTRYIHSNHQSSCTLETNDGGDILTYEEYHPFGTTSYQATNASITAAAKRYRYVGKERDSESGLYYYGARYYVPWLCRFISCDPKASEFPNQSGYNYCFNNPINLIDPSGMTPEVPDDPPKNNEPVTNENPANKLGDLFKPTSGTPTGPNGYNVGEIRAAGTGGKGEATTKQNIQGKDKPRELYQRKVENLQQGPTSENVKEIRAAYTHKVQYGGGDGTGSFADKYFETKTALFDKISNAPLTIQLPLAFAGPLVGSFRGLAAAGELSGIATEMTTMFRGVNSTAGEAYTNALQGTVIPRGGVNGVIDPLAHNTAQGGTVNSLLTSWTTNKDVALHYAFKNSGSGVLMEMEVPASSIIKSPNLHKINLFQSPGTIVSESEVLLKGAFKDINFKPVVFD